MEAGRGGGGREGDRETLWQRKPDTVPNFCRSSTSISICTCGRGSVTHVVIHLVGHLSVSNLVGH
jgi:hypothetical protein